MSPQELLNNLRQHGIELSLKRDGKVHFRYRAGALPDALRTQLVELKSDVMSLLALEAIIRVFPGAQVPSHDAPDQMPELPEDVAFAIGFGFGDGNEGTWDRTKK